MSSESLASDLEFLHFGRHDLIVFLWVQVSRPARTAMFIGETFSTNSQAQDLYGARGKPTAWAVWFSLERRIL